MDLTKFLKLKYLFSPLPVTDFHYYWLFLIIFIGLFIASSLLRYNLRKNKILRKLFKKNLRSIKVLSIIGLILLGSRWQAIPYLSMRILLVLNLGLYLIIMIRLLVIYKKTYPNLLKNLNHHQQKDQYLPKRK